MWLWVTKLPDPQATGGRMEQIPCFIELRSKQKRKMSTFWRSFKKTQKTWGWETHRPPVLYQPRSWQRLTSFALSQVLPPALGPVDWAIRLAFFFDPRWSKPREKNLWRCLDSFMHIHKSSLPRLNAAPSSMQEQRGNTSSQTRDI